MADVSISLDLQAKQLYDDLQRVQTSFAGFASQVTAHGDKAGKGFTTGFTGAFSGLKGAVGGLLGGLGIGIGVGSVVNQFEQAIARGSQLNDIASKFHISAEQLQLIGNAAAQDGVSLEAVARALNRVEVEGVKATTRGSKLSEVLARLGIDAATYAAASPSEKLLQIADAYAKSAKDGQAYADVASVIGVKNTQLIATFEHGRTAIEATSRAMGVMSNETVAAMDKAGDAIHAFKNRTTIGFGDAIVETKKFGGWLEWLNDKVKAGLEKTGLKPSDEAVRGLRAGAGPAPPVPAKASEMLGPENIAPKEGGYGPEFRDVYRTGAEETPEESVKRVAEEAVVSERRAHLVKLQSALGERGLTLGTATGTELGLEEQRLAVSESAERQRQAVEESAKAQADAADLYMHPGKKLEEELGGLQADDSTDELSEQTDLLKEIRDNTAEMGANQ